MTFLLSWATGVHQVRGYIRYKWSGVRVAAGATVNLRAAQEEQGRQEGQQPPGAGAASGISPRASCSQRPLFHSVPEPQTHRAMA